MSQSSRLHVYATAWSLREYPTKSGEWSWADKFAAIKAAGFDGIMSPPREELADRGDLA
jgi:sugar phosphate isomerase/epimerase